MTTTAVAYAFARRLADDLPALRCGFVDAHHVTKAFRRFFGITSRDLHRSGRFGGLRPPGRRPQPAQSPGDRRQSAASA